MFATAQPTTLPSEQRRLDVLHRLDILDTLPEQQYNDIAELAAIICGTPISLVSLVDGDRQWFKAKHGVDLTETPRSESFCAHTLNTGSILIVPDAEADPRFRTNPLVEGEPHIRFYAGAPILHPDGVVLGTVCVLDTVPRTLGVRQIDALEALARQVTALLEQRTLLRRSSEEASSLSLARAELHQTEEQFALAAEAAGIGTWIYDADRQVVVGDATIARLFGLSQQEATAAAWIESIHPEDRDRVTREFAGALNGSDYDIEFRLVPHHTVRWIRSKARQVDYPAGSRLVGICEDITARKRTEEFLHQTGETLQRTAERLRLAQSAGRVAIFEWTLADGVFHWTDSEFAYGRPAADIDNIDRILPLLHPDDVVAVQEAVQPAVDGSGEYTAEFRVLWPDGSFHWLQGFGRPVFDTAGNVAAVVGFNLDVTERKRTEETLLRTEKLAAVGRLASSIAHEINNPLEAVTNLLYLARNSETLGQALPFLDSADLELRRVSAIASQTLRFHRQSTRPTDVTFAQLADGIFTGQHSRMRNAQITVQQRDRAPRPVFCFDGEIRQVLTNLIGNAIDSMHGRGGTVYLRGCSAHDPRTGAAGLRLTVADTGTGIPAAARANIFDAFFTTKGIGGTGLGLWISKEIVDRHHGTLHLRTSEEPGWHGTVFTIFLPAGSAIESATPTASL